MMVIFSTIEFSVHFKNKFSVTGFGNNVIGKSFLSKVPVIDSTVTVSSIEQPFASVTVSV